MLFLLESPVIHECVKLDASFARDVQGLNDVALGVDEEHLRTLAGHLLELGVVILVLEVTKDELLDLKRISR